MNRRLLPGFSLLLLFAQSAPAAEPLPSATPANTWVRLGQADIAGQRWDIPLGWSPELKRFLVLGGRTNWGEYPQPRPYDELALDLTAGRWENWFPKGKEWGPQFGPCRAPAWKDEIFRFDDAEGNVRPNWTVYGTFSLGQKFDYDPDTARFYFYAGGHTFSYDPAARQWADLAPSTDPQTALGGVLLWSSMCYDRHNHQFLLFGGGNIQTERGDPGTWTYSPSSNAWEQLDLPSQPPARANSRMVYDPVNRKVVLFGGDRLDQLPADTWTFDVVMRRWEERTPARSPSPRAGHALIWLPKSQKILLLGGYGYESTVEYVAPLYRRLPLEAWTFDTAAGTWEFVRRWDDADSTPQGPYNFFLSAAANEDDQVVALGEGTFVCQLDASQPINDGTARYGVPPGTVDRRTGSHDPAWYQEDVPPADPQRVAQELADLPENQWVERPTPKRPGMNLDWGSAVFDPDRDLILRFSGGHSAYSGTAPHVYDVKTDRYSIPFAPEYPVEYVYSNDQVHGEWSFQGNPWMTGHTYKSTGYDPNLRALVFAPHNYTYIFDPDADRWSRTTDRNPYRPDFYVATVCATPQGAVVWADTPEGEAGLWRLDPATRTWQALPLNGDLPVKSPDRHGMAYDSRRDRLLLFSDVDEHKGDVVSYDLSTGRAQWLGAAGKEQAAVPSRETVYLPGCDAVLIGAHVQSADGRWLWPLYDCAKNAWFGVELSGADPVGEQAFNNSIGLMYDPHRQLVWAVGQYSQVYVLRIDPAAAGLEELR